MPSRVTIQLSGQLIGVSSTLTPQELEAQMLAFLNNLEFQHVNQPGPYRMHLHGQSDLIKHYKCEYHCPNCKKDTVHQCDDGGHERDSSGDLRTCDVCGWWRSGMSDQYHPPVQSSPND